MREHIVSELRNGSPAQTAGVRKGDRVVSVNNVYVENENTIQVAERVRQIHDTALAFVPRIVVTFIVFLVVFPWMMGTMVSYTHMLLSSFDNYIR